MLALLQLLNLPEASTAAKNFTGLYDFIFYISLIGFVGVVLALLYFVIFYHRKKIDPETTPYIHGHAVLESSVAVGLFVIVMIIFYWGWMDYKKIIQSPSNSLEINVTAKQWLWGFEYLNGRKFTNELTVPKGKPVKLIMTSSDVLHSFFVPAFRLKQDVVPGTYTTLWFNATETGTYEVFCAEYCGTAHSGMLAKIKVVEPGEYDHWQKIWEWEKQLGVSSTTSAVAEKSVTSAEGQKGEEKKENNISPVERGQKLFTEKGCTACHTVNGSPLVGPSLKAVFGHEVELEGGKKVLADENYIRESIVEPQSKIAKGFQPVMPTFKGTLSDDEINALVAYVKSLGN